VRATITRLAPLAIKAEAQRFGILWSAATGLLVQSFDDGSVALLVQPGAHPDATRLVDDLVERGLAESA
jgi:hypothetical protein